MLKKAYICSIHNISLEMKWAKTSEPIVFSKDDLKGFNMPHDDALVSIVVITNFEVYKIIIDSGSAVDILFYYTFLRMELAENRLKMV